MFRYVMALSALVVLTALGCGSGDEGPPVPVHPVTGTVTFQGQPVVGADITFYNEAEKRSAFGRTNDKGEYQLTTFSANDGAVAGKHVVTIAKYAAPAAASEVAPVESEAYVPPTMNQSTDPPKADAGLPEKYASQETSGLIAVVNADAPNKIDFTLTN